MEAGGFGVVGGFVVFMSSGLFRLEHVTIRIRNAEHVEDAIKRLKQLGARADRPTDAGVIYGRGNGVLAGATEPFG
jgi:hypothetical protein